ncbi:hypothetical protein VNO78_11794 [Psophocarpus tetragonolobus]|uniref:Uncharacterized protein n=1 Tax=Psophocarpus tetragonolobus TaxID=3891 RepID=A0AAN9XNY5_PSOTE
MGATSMVRGGLTRFLPGFRRHNFTSNVEQIGDVEFEFLDDGDKPFVKSESSNDFNELDELEFDEDDDAERVDGATFQENKSFWDNQHQLLQTNLYRTTSVESRIRKATKEAVQDIQNAEIVCSCSTQIIARSCRNCLMIELSRRLQNVGYNSAICKTKWNCSPSIPSGKHTFVDVIDSNGKKQEVRVIIELNFRAEFEMAKASEEYNELVKKLPEVYVGKIERLSNIIKVLCMGAKRCMKENKIHMGPWRKHKYMQAKWLGPCKRNTSTTPLSMGYCQVISKPKPRASLLTVDLLEPNFKTEMSNLHCTAVEVL